MKLALILLCLILNPFGALLASDYVPPPNEAVAPRAGYARVFIYRTQASVGRYGFGYGVAPKIVIGAKAATALKQDQFTVVFLKPGTYSIGTEESVFLQALSGYTKLKGELSVVADKTYYLKNYGDVLVPQDAISNTVKASTRDGIWYNALVLSTESFGVEEISRCAYVAPFVQVYE